METLVDDLLLLAKDSEKIATAEQVTLTDSVQGAWHTVESLARFLNSDHDEPQEVPRSGSLRDW